MLRFMFRGFRPELFVHAFKKHILSTVKPKILNTSKGFMKCRRDNFSMGFILFKVNLSIKLNNK